MSATVQEDAQLVGLALAGDRDAFSQIVSRYQSLICSLAYSATGSLAQSEDLAQETFITAWKRLRQLREPEKLRGWLCGIARNRINNSLRRDGHEPVRVAGPIDPVHDSAAGGLLPSEQTISNEEAALLWRSLERIPEIYRDPLILFYRQNESVESVAETLELSEDAVKQRLSRGRKLLHEQVAAFVEGALKQTTPGRAFTLGVLAALPVFATSAGAATVTAAAAKGSATAASSTLVTVVTSFLGPVIGVMGAWFGVCASLDATRTTRERRFVIGQTKRMIVAAVLFNIVLAAYIFVAVNSWSVAPWMFALFGICIPLGFTVFILVSAFRYNRDFREIRKEERQMHPEVFATERGSPLSEFKEYRSRWSFLGLPLVHVRHGARQGEKIRPAVGWIALGNRAYGILFAAGGVAVGAVSMGGAAVGILAMGGAAFGLLAFGGFALGGLALGGGAVGWIAAGGVATAWLGAEGGVAIAREFALGGQVLAQHANDEMARQFFAQYPWMDVKQSAPRNWIVTVCWLPMLLVAWQAWRARRVSGRRQVFAEDRGQ